MYRCQHKSADQLLPLLRDLLPDEPGLHLVADRSSNTLLLRGSPAAQQVATSLLKQMDHPPQVATPPPGADRPTVQVYTCPPGQLDRYVGLINRCARRFLKRK